MPALLMLFWMQAVPPRALVLAMLLSYVMCFAGLVFAYVNYKRRHKQPPDAPRDAKDEREKGGHK